jgi:hypothetical protein
MNIKQKLTYKSMIFIKIKLLYSLNKLKIKNFFIKFYIKLI